MTINLRDPEWGQAIYSPNVERSLISEVQHKFNLCETEALEIVTQAQSKAYRNRHRFNPQKLTLYAWLWVITKRVAIDWMRKRKGISFSDYDFWDLPERLHPAAEDLAGIYKKKVQKERLLQCLDRLPEQERRVIVLKFWKRYSYKQICRLMKLSLRQVRYLHDKGLMRIRRLYRRYKSCPKTFNRQINIKYEHTKH